MRFEDIMVLTIAACLLVFFISYGDELSGNTVQELKNRIITVAP